MHELFTQVLSNKDLSKAGDLFSVADREIVNDLTEVVNTIAEIASLPDYVNNDNDQSVVEICITRVTSAIRETGSIEQHAEALVALLESCLNHNLKPTSRDEDPPHAKISSDIISCIFLNYSKKDVMRRALPVAVKFLHKGNKELSRNMASYLSLAAIENADLLSKHIQLIIDSIISGNCSLCRVLPQIYAVNKEPLHDHVMALVSLLPLCENTEKLALLNLFALIAKNKPTLLEPSLPQLCEYLSQAATASATMAVFLNMAEKRPQLLVDHLPEIKKVVERHPNTLCLAAQVISSVGKMNKDRAQEALNFVLEHLSKADHGSQSTLLREATLLCSSYPVLFTDKMLQEVRQCGQIRSQSNPSNSHVNQISSGVTIVKVGGSGSTAVTSTSSAVTTTTTNVMSNVTSSLSSSNTVAGVRSNERSGVSTSNGSTATSGSGNTTTGSNGGSGSGGTSRNDAALERDSKNGTRSGSNGGIRGTSGSRPELQGCSYISQYNNRYSHIEGSNVLSRQENNRLIMNRPRLGGDSRSTGRLHISAAHRSMTRLNVAGGVGGGAGGSRAGSVGGLHKSMTKLSSSQQINLVPVSGTNSGSGLPPVVNGLGIPSNRSVTAINGQRAGMHGVFSGGVTVTTAQDPVSARGSIGGSGALRDDRELVSISTSFPLNGPPVTVHTTRDSAGGSIGSRLHHPHHASSQSFGQQTWSRSPSAQNAHQYIVVGSQQQQQQQSQQQQSQQNPQSSSQTLPTLPTPPSLSSLPTSATSSSLTHQPASHNPHTLPPQPRTSPPLISPTTTVTPRRPNTSVTIISNAAIVAASQRISVFEPYPMRDTVQHFCEKHLDKIKSYMENVSVRIPPPAKCTIEERRAKKLAKLHFACQGRGEHCLYNRTFFTMKTRNPRIWIHLMFLALQARSPSALSSRDLSVSSLKNCWDTLKCENKAFLTVVTSAFPCAKDQETLLNELRHSGFFDVLEYVGSSDGPLWGCFLCNHPERAVGFLQDTQPVIEGQLKEKKGRWKLFRRWRTRYFTLSPAHLSYKGSKDDKDVTPIEVNQIRSVKVSRGARNIPKAFEIFTGDESLILKPKDGKNAEEWVQCLSVALAHSHAQNSPANKTHSLPASLRTPV